MQDKSAERMTVPVILFGAPFDVLTFETTLDWIDARIHDRRASQISTANLDFLRAAAEDPEMQRILFEADLIMADGHPVVKLASCFGPSLPERVTGSDLTPMLAERAARKGHRLYFLGGAPGVAQKAADILEAKHEGLKVVGCYSPEKASVIEMESKAIIADIKEKKADAVLVALGAPKQEKWIHMHLNDYAAPVSIGIGGTLDFVAGAQRRAPVWLQCLGLEWLGRLLSAPRRMFNRYWLDGIFLLKMLLKIMLLRIWPNRVNASLPGEIARQMKRHVDVAIMTSCDTQEAAEAEAQRIFQATSEQTPLLVSTESQHWLNSVELGVLFAVSRAARKAGRMLMVVPPSLRIQHLLKVQGLDQFITVVMSHDEADDIVNLNSAARDKSQPLISAQHGGQLVVNLPDEVTVSNRDCLAEDDLQRAIDDFGGGCRKIILNAESLRFIDSAGLARIVTLHKLAGRHGIPMVWQGVRGNVLAVLKTVRLDKMIPMEHQAD